MVSQSEWADSEMPSLEFIVLAVLVLVCPVSSVLTDPGPSTFRTDSSSHLKHQWAIPVLDLHVCLCDYNWWWTGHS